MRETITIAGQTFNVPAPFAEGHTLNAGEAAALNQVFHENIRNNLAKKVKEGTVSQADVDAYANTYQFGVRTGGGGGGRTADPVQRRAMDIARQKVRAAIKAKGYDIGNYKAAQITALAEQALEKHPEWVELARRQVAEESAALGDLGLDVPAAAPEQTQEAA